VARLAKAVAVVAGKTEVKGAEPPFLGQPGEDQPLILHQREELLPSEGIEGEEDDLSDPFKIGEQLRWERRLGRLLAEELQDRPGKVDQRASPIREPRFTLIHQLPEHPT
jgi:hypothetical protein